MAYNAENSYGRDLIYSDFPLFYTYVKKRGVHMRKKGHTIGRMSVAVLRQGEHFYLRTSLIVKRGAQSYKDLYTVSGITYNCPSAACRALGLTFDNSEWFSLLNEVKDSSTASSLRQTFAAAIAHSTVSDPQSIWDRFKDDFSDDCLYRIRTNGERLAPPPSEWTEEQCRLDYGLWLFGENLKHLDIDWNTARLADPAHEWIAIDGNTLIIDALNFDREAERRERDDSLEKLSLGHRMVYDEIVTTVENGQIPNTFFSQGPAGTGKTFMNKTICNFYGSQGKIVLCVDSSGIASLLLPNGRTAHSLFRILFDCLEDSIRQIKAQSPLAKLLAETALIIWDEVTMQHKHNFGVVDQTLRDILAKNDTIFGGIPVILGGDFAQILPFVKRGKREQIVNACIRYCTNWNLIRPLFLTQNMRVINGELNQRFADRLSSFPYTSTLYVVMDIPDWIQFTADREIFREFVYPFSQIHSLNSSIFFDRAILTS
ncbi:hypothetical protein EPUL_003771 [Erysiphe pulchra]|uniref:ATP-dependent DNA helicase n=1 Tax=Erysiphe pulchra TaxID=225359 RepID=A0A2S4PPS6_9PEZI|nr:hypothetical protein EPUL_003771 [Erysiphe pulchra]